MLLLLAIADPSKSKSESCSEVRKSNSREFHLSATISGIGENSIIRQHWSQ